MKMIIGFIQPFKIDEVREALLGIGITGMTASEVKGFGRQKGHKEMYRGSEYDVNFTPKIEIKVVVEEESLHNALDTIEKVAKTGQIGDGKLIVLPVEEVIRIRTGEKGKSAI